MSSRNALRSDPNGAHARIYRTVTSSPAWRVLSWSARALYVDLRAKVTGTNNGNINATLSELKHVGWRSPSTLSRALYELQALGFLVKTRGGGVEFGSKVCALYCFTDLEVFDQPKQGVKAMKATHAHVTYKTIAEAMKAKQEGMGRMRAEAIERKQRAKARKKTTLQKTTSDAIEAVAMGRFDATQSVQERSPSLQNV